MAEYAIYQDIATRTGGEIYIGVVGPVRTGKSTFIKRFMEALVLPGIVDAHARESDEVVNAGKLQMSDNPDTTELDESRHTVVISGKLKDNVNLDSYQGMEFTGITIKIDAEQTE